MVNHWKEIIRVKRNSSHHDVFESLLNLFVHAKLTSDQGNSRKTSFVTHLFITTTRRNMELNFVPVVVSTNEMFCYGLTAYIWDYHFLVVDHNQLVWFRNNVQQCHIHL